MNTILALPMALRLAVLFILGAVLGSFVNLACYRLAWRPRPISPWSIGPAKAGRRTWRDRIPILGWLALRREVKFHGSGFWIRPMLVEVAFGLFCAWFYDWSVEQGSLLPMFDIKDQGMPTTNLPLVLHLAFLSQIVLVALMAAASLIDADEQIIPDEITMPGTLLGLLFAAIYPWSLLPADAWMAGPKAIAIDFLRLTSPDDWPLILDGWLGLLIAGLCWWAWCLALMPLRWYGRHGTGLALTLIAARIVHNRLWWLGQVGTMGIVLVWWFAPQAHWAGLLTALVGMAASGALVWGVRIFGTWIFKREAMGFGDVTLMAMMGTFLGWQTCVMVFFLAPFAGLVLGLYHWIFRRENHIPFGPFLCLAALGVIIQWPAVWGYAQQVLELGWLLVALLGICLILLTALAAIRRVIFHES